MPRLIIRVALSRKDHRRYGTRDDSSGSSRAFGVPKGLSGSPRSGDHAHRSRLGSVCLYKSSQSFSNHSQTTLQTLTYSQLPFNMTKVTLNGTVLAESDETVVVENNHYFPPSSVNTALFTDSDTHTVCPWKGTASYYDVNVDGNTIRDAAWYYPKVSDKAKSIKGYIAFYKNKVTIV